MEHCKENGLVRSLGVMNCPVVMFLEILTFCNEKPVMNCLESHPYFTQDECMQFYSKLGCQIAAFAPIAPSENCKVHPQYQDLDLCKESIIKELAQKYHKTEAQIILNWHMRMNHIVFPGMRSTDHFQQNLGVFEFELSQEECDKISSLNRNARFYDRIQDENYSQIPYWM